jgi:hypothetical protein
MRDSTFFVRRGNAMEGVIFEPLRVHMSIEEITNTRVCDLVLVLDVITDGRSVLLLY